MVSHHLNATPGIIAISAGADVDDAGRVIK